MIHAQPITCRSSLTSSLSTNQNLGATARILMRSSVFGLTIGALRKNTLLRRRVGIQSAMCALPSSQISTTPIACSAFLAASCSACFLDCPQLGS